MNRFPAPFILLTLGAMLLSGCARPTPDPAPATDPSEEAQIAAYDAYSTLLFGDMSLLAYGQIRTAFRNCSCRERTTPEAITGSFTMKTANCSAGRATERK